MNVAIVLDAVVPTVYYGGTERVAESLGKSLSKLGHGVTLLARQGSRCDWGRLITYDPSRPVAAQLPDNIDIIHFNNAADRRELRPPYVVTIHGNGTPYGQADPYAIFVSRDHARRAGAQAWVHNGLDWDSYPKAESLTSPRRRLHFLGKAAWKVKNVKGAMAVSRRAGLPLDVLGGHRFNFKMGLRFTFDINVRFHGMVDNLAKRAIISQSRGLVFPVRWHEPFGLAIIDSLYSGAPIFATPYGSIPELVNPAGGDRFGVLSADAGELADAILQSDFSPLRCHEYAADLFNSETMARHYLKHYETAINGHPLNIIPAATPDALPANSRDLPWRQ